MVKHLTDYFAKVEFKELSIVDNSHQLGFTIEDLASLIWPIFWDEKFRNKIQTYFKKFCENNVNMLRERVFEKAI